MMVDLQQFVLYFYPKAADSGHVIVRAAPRHHYDSLRGHLFQHSLTSCYPGFNWHCGRENLEERTMETRIFKRVPFAEPRPNAGGWRPWADIGVRQPFKRGEGIWLMYIHGGAWRDPRIDSSTFNPVWTALEQRTASLPQIRGFIAINYRLAPYPAQAHSCTDSVPLAARRSQHPDPLEDVLTAIRFMQQPQPQPQPEGEGNGERWWGFDGNYVLVGHSAGAALAMSVCSSLADGLLGAGPAVVLPRAVLGAAGIYDYAAMLEGKGEEFRQVMAEIYRSAFGTAEKGRLDGLSPAKIAIRGVKEVMLYWSRDDGLVGEEQVLAMEKCLKETEGVDLRVREVGGMSHEQMYECGWPLADAIESLMREL